jgi:hypothetical protein
MATLAAMRASRAARGSPQRTFEYDYLGRELIRTRGSATWSTTWAYGAGTMIEPAGAANPPASGPTPTPMSTPTRVVTELDGRGRVARREYLPGSEVVNDDLYREEYRYDDRDQIVLVRERRKSGDQQSRHIYDNRGRVQAVERSGNGALSVVERVRYAWKPFDELESMEAPS